MHTTTGALLSSLARMTRFLMPVTSVADALPALFLIIE